jgi:hypothetical protein
MVVGGLHVCWFACHQRKLSMVRLKVDRLSARFCGVRVKSHSSWPFRDIFCNSSRLCLTNINVPLVEASFGAGFVRMSRKC